MIDPQVILDKLAGLGSGDAIARHFRAERITGDYSPRSCPVAGYVARESGQHISVTHSDWSMVNRALLVETRPLPRPVADFVERHDSHAYPELVGQSMVNRALLYPELVGRS